MPPVAGKGKMTEEMETDIDPDDHLVCGCRPQLSLCGTYHPGGNSIIYGEDRPHTCRDCAIVWKRHGCGACGCKRGRSCQQCWTRYQLHLAATNRS